MPRKIISTVPSQTELLCCLGLENEISGITRFCIHPGIIQTKKVIIGGTKNLDLSLIKSLHPDLIIANKEENSKDQIDELSGEFPVWVSDVNNLEDAYRMIQQTGIITGKKEQAEALVDEIYARFEQLLTKNLFQNIRTAYLIWNKPLMAAGSNTFVDDVMKIAGFQNIFSDQARYPETNIHTLLDKNCQLLLLSSEPYHFSQKHIDELKPMLPGVEIVLVSGEMFSWYGSRLMQTPQYLFSLRKKTQTLFN